MSFRFKINKLRFYSSFLLLVFYIIVGSLFLFTEIWQDLLPKSRFVIGIILILFGILRFYIAYRRYINKKIKLNISTKTNEDK